MQPRALCELCPGERGPEGGAGGHHPSAVHTGPPIRRGAPPALRLQEAWTPWPLAWRAGSAGAGRPCLWGREEARLQSGPKPPRSRLGATAGQFFHLLLCLCSLTRPKGEAEAAWGLGPLLCREQGCLREENRGPQHRACRLRAVCVDRRGASYLTLSSRCGSITGDKGTGRRVTEGSSPLAATGQHSPSLPCALPGHPPRNGRVTAPRRDGPR